MEDESQKRCIDKETGKLLLLYELGQLNEREAERFERHLLRCNHCSRQLHEKLPIFEAMQTHKEQIRDELKAEGLEFQPQENLTTSLWNRFKEGYRNLIGRIQWIGRILDEISRPRVLVPVGAVTAVLIAFLILQSPPDADNPYIAHLVFQKIVYRPTQPRAPIGPEAQQLFASGMQAYREDNFKNAADLIAKALELEPTQGHWWLYLGISYYLDRQAAPAIEALVRADSLTEYTLRNTARWYLAQAHLLNNDAASARPVLDSLIEQNREYAQEAVELWDKVESVMRDN